MTVTTEYGTWANHAGTLHVEDTVADYCNGAGEEWLARAEESGSLAAMAAEYRAAINDALPEGVTLNGDEFYGPWPVGRRYDAIAAVVEAVDLGPIVERHDPDLRD